MKDVLSPVFVSPSCKYTKNQQIDRGDYIKTVLKLLTRVWNGICNAKMLRCCAAVTRE